MQNLSIKIQHFLQILILTTAFLAQAKVDPEINLTVSDQTDNSATLLLDIYLKPNQLIYANSIELSIDAPDITLSKLEITQSELIHESNNNEPQMYTGHLTVSSQAQRTDGSTTEKANLHLSFLPNHSKQAVEKIYQVQLFQSKEPINRPSELKSETQIRESNHDSAHDLPETKSTFWNFLNRIGEWIQETLQSSQSWWLKIVLVFLLGILMSLTPCIYPMIPITAGILQAQGSSSISRSFLLSLSYTLGTSTTFAVFGLIAALTGHLFGQLLVSPIFIVCLVAILAYLGLSMFGLYEMYVPSFMQNQSYQGKRGSILSVFALGAISGSIASPCLSPGLALLLTIVATLGNKLLGFLLLFIFGLGLSLPLLIVGTFSNSINIIPQSGSWMDEVKKIFGFMLLGMCIYFLSNILPNNAVTWLTIALIGGAGVYYLKNIKVFDSQATRWLKNSLGIILIAIATTMTVQNVYKGYFMEEPKCQNSSWLTDYSQARLIAIENNYPLLIDCGAEWCSICKAIDKYVFENEEVKAALCKTVLLRVDATHQNNATYQMLKKKYNLIGVPAILLIDPNSEELLKKWGSDLYNLPKNEFIEQIKTLAQLAQES